MEWVLILVLAVALAYVWWRYVDLKAWVVKETARIRREAVKQSADVIRGKVTEHLMPFFPEFQYNPQDARFLGSPVDLIVFDGLTHGDVQRVIFVEVKSSKATGLSARERLVRKCIDAGRVGYELLHVDTARGGNQAVVEPGKEES